MTYESVYGAVPSICGMHYRMIHLELSDYCRAIDNQQIVHIRYHIKSTFFLSRLQYILV